MRKCAALVALAAAAAAAEPSGDLPSRTLSIDKRWPAAALSGGTPTRASGGGACYDYDDEPHKLVVDVSISVAAEAVAGSRQRALQSIQVQFARASEVTLAQFNVWLEMGSVQWGVLTLCEPEDIRQFPSGQSGVFQHLFDFCPLAPYAGLAYVDVSCNPWYSRGITMIDAGWTIFLHELGHNLGAVHDTSHSGLMQYGGLHAYFAAPASRDAICRGLSAALECSGGGLDTRLVPAQPPDSAEHTNTCDEYVVVATEEYDTAAWVGFVFFLLVLLLIPLLVFQTCA